ncbi:hypothetical protein I5Q34_11520 [Streptomyces sp. AV19]|uniref:hypothetical protein n=1 Tax=Streptomyces sp. AV19 TaxID=2793068 RepID=UPI0018FEF89B|nr:hypothetical protein [Streptomyces sp. AV19]MBH1934895.1 hypothetical protein [Streptomyces sp. AV19]MDG4537029.1 hypothetical protein [Streptomyces sp. AV19]
MKTARLLVATLAVALTLSATATTSSAIAGKQRNLSNKHNKQSVTVHKGDEITVRLTGDQSAKETWGWTAPTAANTAILRRDAIGASSTGETTAVFHAHSAGTTTLDSQLRCVSRKSAQTCSDVVVPWQVTVKVR